MFVIFLLPKAVVAQVKSLEPVPARRARPPIPFQRLVALVALPKVAEFPLRLMKRAEKHGLGVEKLWWLPRTRKVVGSIAVGMSAAYGGTFEPATGTFLSG